MENVVKTYFQGVHEQDPAMIRSCFGDVATIRDVCGLQQTARTVPAGTYMKCYCWFGTNLFLLDDLVDRCMEFVTAHPDVSIDFHYGPICDREGQWVVAHWYEVGTWSGASCGIPAPQPPKPMQVEGQTRFRVDSESLKIQEFVVTRTFTDWENAMLAQRAKEAADC